MVTMLKFAAAAALAMAAAGLSYLTTMPRAEATTSFAEAARKLQEARSFSYQFSVSLPGQDKPTQGREFFKEPGLTRTENDAPQASVVILDTTKGKVLSLDPQNKVAILQAWKLADDDKRRAQDRVANTTKYLRSLAEKNGKPVGKRNIGGVEAEGFRIEDEGTEWTVWIDPARKLPLLMETTFRFPDLTMPVTCSDFRIDPPLDDALFRLDPPEGYALRQVDAPILMREDAVVGLLRIYADSSGGNFPPKLDDSAVYQKQFPKEKWKGPDDPEMIRLVQAIAPSIVFLRFELKYAYGYAPDRVKLGEAGKVLFWYRPKGAEGYRAIFGDLHIEDVLADRVPEQLKP